MKYGISTLSVIPCRSEPSDKSEQVTQLLFGEHYKIIEERAKWVKIRTAYDRYESWIDRKQIHEVSKEIYQNLDKIKFMPCSQEMVGVIKAEDSPARAILMGSHLPGLVDKAFTLDGTTYQFDGLAYEGGGVESKDKLVEHGLLYLETPYLWGGRSPFGIDCSGFSQLVYKMIGKRLPRDAYQQAEIGQTLSFVEEAEPGDLAFFDNEDGHIIHVGMLLEENYIIHASGKVRIDRVDHQGIYNAETRSYTHKLRLIKRIL